MSDTRTTYELAAEHIGAYVQPLWPGALAMPFELHDENGRRIAMFAGDLEIGVILGNEAQSNYRYARVIGSNDDFKRTGSRRPLDHPQHHRLAGDLQ